MGNFIFSIPLIDCVPPSAPRYTALRNPAKGIIPTQTKSQLFGKLACAVGRDPNARQERWRGSALPEHPRQLIRDGLEKIAEHRPAFGLQEDFGRHPWRQLQVPKALDLLLLQGNPHIVICA